MRRWLELFVNELAEGLFRETKGVAAPFAVSDMTG